MINKLDHTSQEVSKEIRAVFHASYAIEAKLLGAGDDFPPLKRSLSSFQEADSEFFGYIIDDSIAGVIEIKQEKETTHIQSLVVHPDFFRKGIGSTLLSSAIEKFDSQIYTVETGAENVPAIKLYESHGFKLTNKWMTDFGIEKVAFERS